MACYRDSSAVLYVDVHTSQETPMGYCGLLRGYLYFYIYVDDVRT
jgi:hypothetical protein